MPAKGEVCVGPECANMPVPARARGLESRGLEGVMSQAPITDDEQLETASVARLSAHLGWELQQVKDDLGCSNQVLANELGYTSSSTVTRWLNQYAVVSVDAAKKLDELGFRPQVGGSFAALRQAYKQASKRRPGGLPQPGSYEVFLASPMESAADQDSYEAERQAALDLKRALETWCGFSVLYAGETLESGDAFETPEIAAETNFRILELAQFFILFTQTSLARPSSVHVEAGFALARKIPSLYFVPDPKALPYVLRKLGEHRTGQLLPAVSVQYVDTVDQAISLVKRHGPRIFERLAEVNTDGAKRRERR
jgi:hypothetical protein